jgi:hypothetical protein
MWPVACETIAVLPPAGTPLQLAHLKVHHHQTSFRDKMPTAQDIESAIAELRAAKKPNISQVARDYKIGRTQLQRLFNGTRATRAQYIDSKHLLSPQQDIELVKLLDRLTRDGIPPTAKIVRQLAHSLCGKLPAKNWPSNWLKHHSGHLDSSYLIGFDLNRKKADNYYQYKAYFSLVIRPITHKLTLIIIVKAKARSISRPTQQHL